MDEQPQPRSNTLRILLIVLGGLIGIGVLCWVGSLIVGRIAESQAPRLATMMIATLEQSGAAGSYSFPLSTFTLNELGTPEPLRKRRPALTFHPYTPSPTSAQLLPQNALCVPDGKRERGFVIEVISGDTIRVVVREQTWLVRYIGIHSPHVGLRSEQYAIEAMVANRSLVENQVITMISDFQDVDDTKEFMLRYVFTGDTFVNDEMLRRGFARTESVQPNIACDFQFLKSQQEAIDSRLGLWRDIAPSSTPEPTSTPRTLCDCQGPLLTCSDFTDQTGAQICFDSCKLLGLGDIFNLDSDHDGLACSP